MIPALLSSCRQLAPAFRWSAQQAPRAFGSASLRQNRERLGLQRAATRSDAVRAAETVAPENSFITAEIQRAVKRRDWHLAEKSFQGCHEPNTIVYTVMINAAAILKQHSSGLGYFESMAAAGIPANSATYSAVLKIYGEKSMWQEARQLWEHMLSSDPDSANCPSCLHGFLNTAASAGDVAAVRQEIEAARARGIEVDSGHFGCLIKAHRQGRDGSGALQVLYQMQVDGMKPDIIHLTMALGACVREVEEGPNHSMADEYLAWVLGELARNQIPQNKYFVEEHVAMCLRVAALKDVPTALRQGRCRQEDIDKAAQVMLDFANSGGELTRALKMVKRELDLMMSLTSNQRAG